jgi:hypothetical protein
MPHLCVWKCLQSNKRKNSPDYTTPVDHFHGRDRRANHRHALPHHLLRLRFRMMLASEPRLLHGRLRVLGVLRQGVSFLLLRFVFVVLLPWQRKSLLRRSSTAAGCKSLRRNGGTATGRTPAAAQAGTCRAAAQAAPRGPVLADSHSRCRGDHGAAARERCGRDVVREQGKGG